MLSRQDFDAYCASLPATSHVIQWGDASVWKVGGKIFAICSDWGQGAQNRISFKCSDLAYEILREQAGIQPAPYLARAKWVQLLEETTMTDEDIRDHIRIAHQLVSQKLTKAKQRALGLLD